MTVPHRVAPEESPFPSIDVMIDRFEAAGHDDGSGDKCWYARDLAVLLGYTRWESFPEVLAKAQEAALSSGHNPADHFRHVPKMIPIGKGGTRAVDDVELTRYAAYLTAQNADPRKQPVAIAQTYFAIQTRRQELADQNGVDFSTLSESQQRMYLRNQVVAENKKLGSAAKVAGVKTGTDFAIFHNKGIQGLYGGMGVKEVQRYKGLAVKAKILDHMGSTELAANLFRITQTEEKLRSKAIVRKDEANRAHFEVGQKVRQTMRDLSGIYPEDLPVAPDVRKIASAERKARKLLYAPPSAPSPVLDKPAAAPIVSIDLRNDLWKYTLLIMSTQPGQQITTTALIAELPNFIHIDDDKAEPTSSRKDSRFSQIVRNLKSHKATSTNFICRGFAEDTPGGFKITQRGLQFVQEYFGDPKSSSIEERYELDQYKWVAQSVGLTVGELAELEWDLLPIEGGDTFTGYMVAFAEGSDRRLLQKVRGLGQGYTVQVGFPPDDDDPSLI